MMVVNMALGGAAASVLARLYGAELHIWTLVPNLSDVESHEDVRWSRRQPVGVVGNLRDTDAMDVSALEYALKAGAEAVTNARRHPLLIRADGHQEHDPASAICARLLGCSAHEMVGPGTGVSGTH